MFAPIVTAAHAGGTAEAVVDIGIPARDQRARGRPLYIAETIESVLAQSFTDWRLTISENNPGAGTLGDVLAPYLADPRVRHVVTNRDLSAAGNSTSLLEGARAPFVALVHDDDYWIDPDFLARRVEFLQAHPDCGFVYGGCVYVDEEGVELARYRPAFGPGVHPPEEFVRNLLVHRGKPMPPTSLVRRAAYEAVGPAFDERFPGFDYEMWLRLGARYACGYLDVWDAAFRIHARQASWPSAPASSGSRSTSTWTRSSRGTSPRRCRRPRIAASAGLVHICWPRSTSSKRDAAGARSRSPATPWQSTPRPRCGTGGCRPSPPPPRSRGLR